MHACVCDVFDLIRDFCNNRVDKNKKLCCNSFFFSRAPEISPSNLLVVIFELAVVMKGFQGGSDRHN